MRLDKQDYENIKQKYNVERTWSFSRIQSYIEHKYEYFLKNVKKINGDLKDSIYTDCGSLAHDILEKYYNDEISREQMIIDFNSGFLDLEMKGKKFDRNDDNNNEKLKDNYEECLQLFFQQHNKPDYKFKTELPVEIVIDPETVLVGFIDFIGNESENIYIIDYKTSSIYSGADLENKSIQLLLYAEGIKQRLKLKNFDNIKPQFNFLKYVNVEFEQLNGKTKSRNIERNKLGEKLESTLNTFFKKETEYNENEINLFIQKFKLTNDIEVIPKEVRDKFKISDCIVDIEINQEKIDNLKNKIKETINQIIIDEEKYKETNDEKIFWENVEKKDSYYYANLSEFSWKLHEPYKQYLIKNQLLINQFDNNDNDIEIKQENNELDEKWKDLFGE